jgi:hypothetical protein
MQEIFYIKCIILAQYGEEPGSCRAGRSLLKNLKILLVFWQEHYLHKDKVNMLA